MIFMTKSNHRRDRLMSEMQPGLNQPYDTSGSIQRDGTLARKQAVLAWSLIGGIAFVPVAVLFAVLNS